MTWTYPDPKGAPIGHVLHQGQILSPTDLTEDGWRTSPHGKVNHVVDWLPIWALGFLQCLHCLIIFSTRCMSTPRHDSRPKISSSRETYDSGRNVANVENRREDKGEVEVETKRKSLHWITLLSMSFCMTPARFGPLSCHTIRLSDRDPPLVVCMCLRYSSLPWATLAHVARPTIGSSMSVEMTPPPAFATRIPTTSPACLRRRHLDQLHSQRDLRDCNAPQTHPAQ